MSDEGTTAVAAPEAPAAQPETFGGARSAARERFQSEAPTPPAPTGYSGYEPPEEPPSPEPETPPPQEPTTAAEAIKEVFEDFDFEGRRYQVKPEELRYLAQLGAQHLRREGAPKEEPAPAPQAPRPEAPDPYASRFEKLEKTLQALAHSEEQRRHESHIQEIMSGARAATEQLPIFKEFASEQDIAGVLLGHVMMVKDANAGVSFETAAKKVADVWEKIRKKDRENFLKSKIAQAGKVPAGAGGTPAPAGKDLGPKDLATGAVKRSAMARFVRAMSGGE